MFSFVAVMGELKIEIWLKAGYDLLGAEGMEGVKIERIARSLGLNKSGFYYYFKTMEGYLTCLVQYHVHMAGEVAAEILRCQRIDPDLLRLIVRRKSFFLVESQLLVKSRFVHIKYGDDEAGKIITSELLNFWKRSNNELNTDVAVAYLNIIRHFIYARIDAENITYEFLHDLAVETKKAFEKIALAAT